MISEDFIYNQSKSKHNKTLNYLDGSHSHRLPHDKLASTSPFSNSLNKDNKQPKIKTKILTNHIITKVIKKPQQQQHQRDGSLSSSVHDDHVVSDFVNISRQKSRQQSRGSREGGSFMEVTQLPNQINIDNSNHSPLRLHQVNTQDNQIQTEELLQDLANKDNKLLDLEEINGKLVKQMEGLKQEMIDIENDEELENLEFNIEKQMLKFQNQVDKLNALTDSDFQVKPESQDQNESNVQDNFEKPAGNINFQKNSVENIVHNSKQFNVGLVHNELLQENLEGKNMEQTFSSLQFRYDILQDFQQYKDYLDNFNSKFQKFINQLMTIMHYQKQKEQVHLTQIESLTNQNHILFEENCQLRKVKLKAKLRDRCLKSQITFITRNYLFAEIQTLTKQKLSDSLQREQKSRLKLQDIMKNYSIFKEVLVDQLVGKHLPKCKRLLEIDMEYVRVTIQEQKLVVDGCIQRVNMEYDEKLQREINKKQANYDNQGVNFNKNGQIPDLQNGSSDKQIQQLQELNQAFRQINVLNLIKCHQQIIERIENIILQVY
eukprot:403367346